MWNNRVVLSGNLVRDVEVKIVGEDQKAVTNFTIAVQRTRSKEGTDFLNCVAWGQSAIYLGKYGLKGSHIQLEGQLHTGSYEKDGKKVYITEVYVDNCHLQKKQDTAKPSGEELGYAVGSMYDDYNNEASQEAVRMENPPF